MSKRISNDILDELRAASIALDTAGVGTQTTVAEREKLSTAFRDATVVGLGEVGHGISEMYGLRARLCRALIEELGYRHLALEADYTGTQAIDRYVAEGTGTVEEALRTAGVHAFWRNEAMADFLQWVRSFNQGRPADDRVRFHGLDIQHGGPTAGALRSYLEAVDQSLLAEVAQQLDTLIETPFGFGAQPDEETADTLAAACEELSTTLQSRFESNQDAYRVEGGEDALAQAERQTMLVSALGEMADAYEGVPSSKTIEVRERTLADSVSWLLDEAGPAGRVAVLAHNLHVKRGTWRGPLDEVPAMGEFLHERFGDAYRPIGGCVGTGRVRTISTETEEFEEATIPDPPDGSLPHVLTEGWNGFGLFNFQALSEGGPAATWLSDEPVRQALAAKAEGETAEYFEADPRAAFDGLIFVGEATPAASSDA